MNIKDYLHLYLGCEVYQKGGLPVKLTPDLLTASSFTEGLSKPILRPLSDMTEEERKECYVIGRMRYPAGAASMNIHQIDAVQFKYLLSKHFDLFGLIEAGLAIDKTKINIAV